MVNPVEDGCRKRIFTGSRFATPRIRECPVGPRGLSIKVMPKPGNAWDMLRRSLEQPHWRSESGSASSFCCRYSLSLPIEGGTCLWCYIQSIAFGMDHQTMQRKRVCMSSGSEKVSFASTRKFEMRELSAPAEAQYMKVTIV